MGIDTNPRDELDGPEGDENIEGPADEEIDSTIEGPLPTAHPDIFKVKWRIKNFASLTDPLYRSPIFLVSGVKWCILLYPKLCIMSQGTPPMTSAPNLPLSIFLESKPAMDENPLLEADACFELMVENANPVLSERKQLYFKFTSNGTDWGFRDFMKVAVAMNPQNGFLVQGALVIQVMIRRLKDLEVKEYIQNKDPYLWVRDSKAETGFVGLKNQGATCYMNSLLQALYHVPALRKAVYQMPTEVETMKRQRLEGLHPALVRKEESRDMEESIALALQVEVE